MYDSDFTSQLPIGKTGSLSGYDTLKCSGIWGKVMDQDDANRTDALNLHELLKYSEENLQRLRQKIKSLRNDENTHARIRNQIRTKDLEAVLKEVPTCKRVPASKIDNFINNRTDRLEPPCYQAIVRHIWDIGGWENSQANEPGLFHALAEFLGIQTQTLHNLATEIPGTYRVWRASMHVPGSFIQGMMKITHDENNQTVWVVETHAFQGEGEASGASEDFEGYIVKKSRYYVIIARQQEGHRGAPRITVIHNTLSNGTAITAMYGFVTGCYGSNGLFAAPIYIERVHQGEEPTLKGELKIVGPDEIPASIRAKLRVRVDDGLIRF